MSRDPLEALQRHYENLSRELPPSDLGLPRVRKQASPFDLLRWAAPLSGGALLAVLVVQLSNGAPTSAVQPAADPALTRQIREAGLNMADYVPPKPNPAPRRQVSLKRWNA